MNIDKRLRSIINEIEGDTLVDVGCDHGKVTYFARKENRVNKVIATDISQKSLNKCVDLINKEIIENVEFRCGDGLDVVKDNEADIVCIAGMGGYEIIKILSRAPKGIKKLVLCPHQDIKALREYLQDSWRIQKDSTIYIAEHFYNLIVAIPGKQKLSSKELLLGQDSIDNKDYVLMLNALKEKYKKIETQNIPQSRFEECEEVLRIINGELDGSKKDI